MESKLAFKMDVNTNHTFSLPAYLKTCVRTLWQMVPSSVPVDSWWRAKLGAGLILLVLQGLISLLPILGIALNPFLLFGLVFVLTTVLQTAIGLPCYRVIFNDFKNQKGKALVCVALWIAYVYPTVSFLVTGAYPAELKSFTPLDIAAVGPVFLALHLYFETKLLDKVVDGVGYLETLRVFEAHQLVQGEPVLVPTENLKVGDRFVVHPGELIPRDGLILKGTTSVDESDITSETVRLLKDKGETVIGGSINRDSEITVEVTHERADDTLEILIAKANSALSAGAPLFKRLNRTTNTLLNLSVLLALLCWAYHYFYLQMTFGTALTFALTILASAPLALIALSHLSFFGFVSQSLRRGIAFSDNLAVDKLAGMESIFFNKTGTLSLGDFVYSQCFIENGTNMGQFLSALFSIEQESNHPLAKAMSTHPWYIEIPKIQAKDSQTQAGLGTSAILCPRGYEEYLVAAGNLRYVKRMRFNISRDMKAKIDDLEEMGETVVLCGFNRHVRGVISFADTLRKGVRGTLRRIQKLGVETALITGDTEKTVTQLTGAIGIKKIYSRCTPEEKAAKILKEKESGKLVAVVDSDLEDNPAFSAADLSLSIETGTNIKNHPADILILGSDFSLLYWLIHKAKTGYQTIRIAEMGSALLTVLLTAGAFAGWVPPLFSLSLTTLWSVASLNAFAKRA